MMQCRNATQLFSSSSFCIFENLTATYRTTKMAISQILDTLKGSRHGFRSAECLEFFFEVVSRRRFSDDVNHGFQWGKLCVVGSIHGILDVGSLEDDAETFYFCSSVPSSCLVFLLSSSRLFGSQFSRVGSWRSRPQTSLSQYLKSNKPRSQSCNRVISRVKTT